MTLTEARTIVAKMVQWSMYAQGLQLDEKPQPITEDLQTLINANRAVERNNARRMAYANKVVQQKGCYKSRTSTPMTIADRGIAALYVAANFPTDDPRNCTPLAIQGNAALYLLDTRHLTNDDDQ